MQVSYMKNVTCVTDILDMVAIANYNLVLSEDFAHAQRPKSVTHYKKDLFGRTRLSRNIVFYFLYKT